MQVDFFLRKRKRGSASCPPHRCWLFFFEVQLENVFIIITVIIILENKGRNRDFENVYAS